MPEFMLDDGHLGLIRVIDLHDATIEMARKLGIRGEVRTMVGKWEDNGQLTGWTKKAKAGTADVLLEVFVSKLDDERRESNRYAVEMLRLIEENKLLKAQLASAGEAGTATTVEQGVVHEHATGKAGDAQQHPRGNEP
jgi:hypothetical protein